MIYENITTQSFSSSGTTIYSVSGVGDVYGFLIQTNTEEATLSVVADGARRLSLHLKDDIKDGLKLKKDSPDWVQEYESKRYSVCFPSPVTFRDAFSIVMQSDSGTKRLERGLVIREY